MPDTPEASSNPPEVFMVEDLPMDIDVRLAKEIAARGGSVIHENNKAQSFLPIQRLRDLFAKIKPRTDIKE
ncbi:MAG: hypothetical protein AAB481_04780 [Patescibacteria group bacterium]